MSNYLTRSTMYNCGIIPRQDAYIRIKQKLAPQYLENTCAYKPAPASSYPFHGEMKDYTILPISDVIQPKSVQPPRGDKPIPDNTPCLRYLHAI